MFGVGAVICIFRVKLAGPSTFGKRRHILRKMLYHFSCIPNKSVPLIAMPLMILGQWKGFPNYNLKQTLWMWAR